MQKNNVILLDEFDYYKSEKDNASSNFVHNSSLTKVLMTSDEGKNIIQKSLLGEQPISGTMLVASQINPNQYYDVHSQNLTQTLREDYFEILLRYAPFFGASEVIITYEVNDNTNTRQSEKEKYQVKGDGSYKGFDARASYGNSSSQDGSNTTKATIKLTKSQKTNPKLKKATREEIIKCFEEDGIAYNSIPLFSRMLTNFNGTELIKEGISISKTVQSSDKILKQLEAAISAKNILFTAQLHASYMSETLQTLQTFQSTEIEISIQFHIPRTKILGLF
ncbi:hypothetical protein [Sulfuricurvum sp.]|uniref:hypothetical protein n=1 Tax=Sulfuricurvum sp. TaxID=2025608 RepID=UPI002D4DAFBA|nr:hypothetical protein [Sulfuricurvum sp.]HZF71242.1 hypothetical protein [Sulfuricurvum sp.]